MAAAFHGLAHFASRALHGVACPGCIRDVAQVKLTLKADLNGVNRKGESIYRFGIGCTRCAGAPAAASFS